MLPPPPLRLFALDTSEPINTLIDCVYATSEVTKTMLQALTEPAHRFPRWLQRDTRVAKGDCIAINGRIFIKDRLFIPPDKELRL